MNLNLLTTALLLLIVISGSPLQAAPAEPPGLGSHLSDDYSQANSHKSAVIDRMMSRAKPNSRVKVIVGLDASFVSPGRLNALQRNKQRQKIKEVQIKFAAKLPKGKFAEKRRFKNIPFMAMEIDSPQLAQLKSMPEIASIQEDVLSRPNLASSNQVIGSPSAWNTGYDGASQAIAILDTGIDMSHPYFAASSKIISEACFSTNSAAQGATSACPGGVESSTAVGSADTCSTARCNHGTHVAGIAAGNDLAGPNFGVARGAKLIAVQVFSDFVNSDLCGSSQPCPLSYSSDQIAALEYIYTLRNSYDIAAVNLSLGAGAYSGYCDVSEVARKAAIDNLRSVGIATVISSGNGSNRDALQAPACISSAISVGATNDSDAIASFSNVSDFISLLAPGISITSAVPGDGTANFNGTSLAAPHVAGAWAILKQKSPDASVDDILQALYETGTEVDDNRGGGQITGMRRINVGLAANPDQPGVESDMSGLYVPVVGCRIVDSRQTGLPLRPLVETPFLSGRSDQDLRSQGGTPSGCGIPEDVAAIDVNFTIIAERSTGYLRSWPFGQPEPNATVLAWNGGTATNALSLSICTNKPCSSDFVVKIYSKQQGVELVIDLVGYYY
jgi:subtilisin